MIALVCSSARLWTCSNEKCADVLFEARAALRRLGECRLRYVHVSAQAKACRLRAQPDSPPPGRSEPLYALDALQFYRKREAVKAFGAKEGREGDERRQERADALALRAETGSCEEDMDPLTTADSCVTVFHVR